ncbi:MAG: helix-turn-helix domain-containing protein, partial [Verrucomicrobiae bacterium]|nr:helix-turn-helix domain-containing protein [Verrucomicrobiae bacterium]
VMSVKERRRLQVLSEVSAGRMSLRQAGEVMGLGYRQARRVVYQRYRRDGDGGLVHRLRGRRSARAKPAAYRQRVLARAAERYPDFGPTRAAEYLAGEGLKVDHETLRRWLLASGRWQLRRRGQRHRQWRERRAHFGERVQLDGSDHDGFEGRRPRCVLRVAVDDATNRTGAQFVEAETTAASY